MVRVLLPTSMVEPSGACLISTLAQSQLSRRDGWVAPGGYPPEAPTDPDVRDSRIRLLGEEFRYGR